MSTTAIPFKPGRLYRLRHDISLIRENEWEQLKNGSVYMILRTEESAWQNVFRTDILTGDGRILHFMYTMEDLQNPKEINDPTFELVLSS